MDSATETGAGGRLRERIGQRPAAVFGALGIALVAGGFAVPSYETILLAWGGTGLFVALLVQFVMPTPTIPASVATDLQATAGGNVRRLAGDGDTQRYVPSDGSVTLVFENRVVTELDPVGERLLASVDAGERTATADDQLSVLADTLVNELELADRVQVRRTDEGADVTVTGSRIGTDELLDHPVVSVLGVGLATAVKAPVLVEPTVEEDRLVVACRWH